MNLSIVGRALLESCATSLSARVTVAADGLLGLVPEGVATGEAGSGDSHDGEAVRLGLSSGAGSAGQKSGRGGSSVEHLDGVGVGRYRFDIK